MNHLMQYLYHPESLKLARLFIDEDGDTHAIYDLPAPKGWVFRKYLTEDSEVYIETNECVSRVRVVISPDEFTRIPMATVVPYGPDGEEHPVSAVHFAGVTTMIGVLDRMGFAPILPVN